MNIVGEYAGNTLSKSYTWGMDISGNMQGAGGFGGLLAVGVANSGYYPTYDGNGNVSEYLDGGGNVQAHYEYDAFGNTLVANGAMADDFAHRFSTKPLDAETGLYYYGYNRSEAEIDRSLATCPKGGKAIKYYDPNVGRWLNRDPIGERGGYNLYGFVRNDGVNQLNHLGMLIITGEGAGYRASVKAALEKVVKSKLK